MLAIYCFVAIIVKCPFVPLSCSSHGFAINVGGPSLLPAFDAIVPCGIQAAGHGVTSLQAELHSRLSQWQQQETVHNQGQGCLPSDADFSKRLDSVLGSPGAGDCSNIVLSNVRQQAASDGIRRLHVDGIAELVEKDFAEQFGYQEVFVEQIAPPI